MAQIEVSKRRIISGCSSGHVVTMSEPPKLEQCVEETEEGSKKSQLVVHSKVPAMITEGLSIEADLLASSHSSLPVSPNHTSTSSNHAPEIERQNKHDREGPELWIKRDGGQLMIEATMDASAVQDSSGIGKTGHSIKTIGEDSSSGTSKTGHSTRTGKEGSSGTGKTGHSTRSKKKRKTATHKRQLGELKSAHLQIYSTVYRWIPHRLVKEI